MVSRVPFALGLAVVLAGCRGCDRAPPDVHDAAADANAGDARAFVAPRTLEPAFRALGPMTSSVTASAVVVFTWAGGKGLLELSRSRTFAEVARAVQGDGSVTVPDLPRGVFFWRVVGPDGTTTAPRVIRIDGQARTPVRQGLVTGTDVNGDGLADAAFSHAVLLAQASPPAQRSPHFANLASDAECNIVVGDPWHHRPNPRCWSPRAELHVLGDLDGDGFDELGLGSVYWRGRPTWADEPALPTGSLPALRPVCEPGVGGSGADFVALGDIDGDGFGDTAQYVRCTGSPALAAGGCAQFTLVLGSSHELREKQFSPSDYRNLAGGGDVDGDGYDDIIGLTSWPKLALHRGGPAGVRAQPDLLLPVEGDVQACDLESAVADPPLRVADVNADGLADVVVVTKEERYAVSNRWVVSVFQGQTNGAPLTLANSFVWAAADDFREPSWVVVRSSMGAALLVVGNHDILTVPLQSSGVVISPAATRIDNGIDSSYTIRQLGDVDGDDIDDAKLSVRHMEGSEEGIRATLLLGGRLVRPSWGQQTHRWFDGPASAIPRKEKSDR